MASAIQTTTQAQCLCLELAAAPGDFRNIAAAIGELFLVVDNLTVHRKSAIALVMSASKALLPVLETAKEGGPAAGSAELQEPVQDLMQTIQLMRCFVEDPPKFILKRARDAKLLQQQVKKNCKKILSQPYSSIPSSKASILEAVNLSAQIAVAVCDAPILNMFKPVANVVGLVNGKVMAIEANKEAAVALARQLDDITNNVLKPAVAKGAKSDSVVQSLETSVQEAALLLREFSLQRKYDAWLSATSDSIRLENVNARLKDALAVYATKEIVEATALLRKTTQQVSQLVAVVDPKTTHWNKSPPYHVQAAFLFFLNPTTAICVMIVLRVPAYYMYDYV
ncbi:hypothetical protein MIND_00838300 [Mycena indigotica]|uniref:Uncharacterized protein n=1 Tax=Mycena indigotica TaxID=2126181 RepID=A0A8H6SG28_9AGAR|nr:uncharacterized protein MIND_00838300 [Mycena indigotica]KAF7298903.1 hypothetical protein MIND_00838300 [Mycena indigotica]